MAMMMMIITTIIIIMIIIIVNIIIIVILTSNIFPVLKKLLFFSELRLKSRLRVTLPSFSWNTVPSPGPQGPAEAPGAPTPPPPLRSLRASPIRLCLRPVNSPGGTALSVFIPEAESVSVCVREREPEREGVCVQHHLCTQV